MAGEACRRCGASDWGTRNRCNGCRKLAAKAARVAADEPTRAKERARLNAWRAANPEKRKAQQLRSQYRITPADLNRLLVQQDGCCAICKSQRVECVDHSHSDAARRQNHRLRQYERRALHPERE